MTCNNDYDQLEEIIVGTADFANIPIPNISVMKCQFPEYEEEFAPAYEIHVFDFDLTLQHNYKPLPCVEIMRESLLAGVPVYIVTARKPNKGQEKHISEVLSWWDISLDKECIFAVGDDPKGPYVADLLK